MSQKLMENVIGHWSKLIEDFKTSPLDFYAQLDGVLQRRGISGLKATNVDWNEGGIVSPRRTYLKVGAERLEFHICAAPFGTGFFFSWWLVRRPPAHVLLYWFLILAVMGILFGVFVAFFNALRPMGLPIVSWIFLAPLASAPIMFLPGLTTFWLVALAARAGTLGPEDAVLSTPLVAGFYRWVFAPITFYQLDTAIMLRTAVHGAVVEVIDGLTSQKGLRALSENDRKPLFDLVA